MCRQRRDDLRLSITRVVSLSSPPSLGDGTRGARTGQVSAQWAACSAFFPTQEHRLSLHLTSSSSISLEGISLGTGIINNTLCYLYETQIASEKHRSALQWLSTFRTTATPVFLCPSRDTLAAEGMGAWGYYGFNVYLTSQSESRISSGTSVRHRQLPADQTSQDARVSNIVKPRVGLRILPLRAHGGVRERRSRRQASTRELPI